MTGVQTCALPICPIVTPTNFGTVTISARQTGDLYYTAAAPVVSSFEVTRDNLNTWRIRYFTPGELNNPLLSGPLADFDGDGVNNLFEFALNRDPKLSDRTTMIAGTGTAGLPLIRAEDVSGQQRLTAEYVRRQATGRPGITYHVEFTSGLTNPAWLESGTEVVTQIDDTWERVKVTDQQPAFPNRYSRLKVTMP